MIPVSVVGGYLGAGKTTLVNHLLRTANGLRIAVLVNDFGELPIDASLIEGEKDGVVSIAGGCICCAVGSDLMASLQRLQAFSPQCVLLETSGVALPGPVAASVRLVPGFALDAVVVVADAETVRERAADRYMGDTIERQLAQADIVVLNKADLVEAAAFAELRDWLRAKAPRAVVIEAVRAEVPKEVLLGQGFNAERPTGALGSGAIRPEQSAASLYESVVVQPPHQVDVHAFAVQVARRELGVIRTKGVLRDISGECLLLQGVGSRYEVSTSDAAPVGLVCIGLKGTLDAAAIRVLMAPRRL